MKKVKLDILGLSSSVDSQTGSFALVLKENKGDRRLPIIIGMFEHIFMLGSGEQSNSIASCREETYNKTAHQQ